jgi:hypothetical protein
LTRPPYRELLIKTFEFKENDAEIERSRAWGIFLRSRTHAVMKARYDVERAGWKSANEIVSKIESEKSKLSPSNEHKLQEAEEKLVDRAANSAEIESKKQNVTKPFLS